MTTKDLLCRFVKNSVCVIIAVGIMALLVVAVKTATDAYIYGYDPFETCVMPKGWKIITDGEKYSWEDNDKWRSINEYSTKEKACRAAVSMYDYNNKDPYKKSWKYAK